MKVKIVKCSLPSYWYADKIGEVIDVIPGAVSIDFLPPYFLVIEDNINGRGVVTSDVEVLDES